VQAKKAAALPPTLEEVDALFHIFDGESTCLTNSAREKRPGEAASSETRRIVLPGDLESRKQQQRFDKAGLLFCFL
jgi:hypothetical protein